MKTMHYMHCRNDWTVCTGGLEIRILLHISAREVGGPTEKRRRRSGQIGDLRYMSISRQIISVGPDE